MSIEDVGDQPRGMLVMLPDAQLQHALTCLEQAQAQFEQATRGSGATEPAEVVGHYALARSQIEELQKILELVRAAIQRYIEQTGAHESGGATADEVVMPASSPSPRVNQDARSAPAQRTTSDLAKERPTWDFSPDEVNAVMAELPPRVENPNTEGRKTHGQWVDEDGHSDRVVSGRDEDAQRVEQTLQELGCPVTPTTAADVEMKLAQRMRDNKVKRLTVIINNVPCAGKWSCDRLVPILLPEGYELTVYGVDGFKKVYRGGKQPSWKRR